MGSCVSVHKNSPGSAIKLVTLGSNRDEMVIPASPVKDDVTPGPIEIGSRPIESADRNSGSKEETFFDSQPWVESDYEDDFLSVNGDFTPSRANTPVHQSFCKATPQINTAFLEQQSSGLVSETSPIKTLVELFKEHKDEDKDAYSDAKTKILDLSVNPKPTATYVSGSTNSLGGRERNGNGDPVMEKEKSIRSVQGCIPRLVSCSSFTERRRKMSPAIAVNDN